MSNHDKPCPNCGHCPTCGRSNFRPWHPVYPYARPYGPYYVNPYYSQQTTTGTSPNQSTARVMS